MAAAALPLVFTIAQSSLKRSVLKVCSSSREASLGEFPHHLDQVRLAFKADPRNDVVVLHPHTVGEAAVRLEEAG
jgi:hypothetical protein